jgi:hypothetical protein
MFPLLVIVDLNYRKKGFASISLDQVILRKLLEIAQPQKLVGA